jgi:type II secretory ATPase GspE/PulE/Tfp pilus assembly ATPase PilB-like protein
VVDEVVRDSVMQKLATRALQQVAVQQGMVNLWQMGLHRVIKGETTLEEILRVVAADQM